MEEGKIEYKLDVKDKELAFRRASARDNRVLVYRKELCNGCWLCYDACPLEAIDKNPAGSPNRIDINPEKCELCGICADVCTFGSLELLIDGKPVKKSERTPHYEKLWSLDEHKCKLKDEEKRVPCKDCEEACPRNALKCEVKIVKGKAKNIVQRDENLCIMCTTCKHICPEKAIRAEKFFEGEIKVDLDKCQGCGICVDVCPSKAITMPKSGIGEKREKLLINNDACIYCGACANACPTKAIEVKRTSVKITKEAVEAGAHKRKMMFEKLISKS